jgi:Tol biopolymer transport system component
MPELKEVFEMVTKQTEPDLDSWKQQEQKQRRTARNRRVGAFALVAALGIVAAVIAINASAVDDTERTGAPPEPIPGTSTHMLVDLETGRTSPLPSWFEGGFTYAVAPSGEEVAFAPWPDPIGDDRHLNVYVTTVDGPAVRRVTPVPVGIDQINPRWSPQGQIVFQGRNAATEEIGNLYLLDPVDGTTEQLTDLPFGLSHHWFMSPSFRPDGQAILFNLPRTGSNDQASLNDQTWDLWTIPATGGEPTLVRRNAAHGSYSPTASTIAYLHRPGFDLESNDFGAGSIWLADADGGDPRLLVEGTHMHWPRWSPDGTRIAYVDEGGVYVVDVATSETSRVMVGGAPEWLDDHTLIVERA